MAYTVTFWGTRGSIPTPGPHTARYGGNTPCVAVESSGGQVVILDAGTGIRALGLELVERQNGAVRAEILLSHAHWDHIQGLPHFKPFFAPGNADGTDKELGSGGNYGTPASWHKEFVAFLADTELLIHDAMYTPPELEEHRGWGHSTFEEAVALAAEAGVRRLVLFHHEPEHGDTDMDGLLAAARRLAKAKGKPGEVLAAQEGMKLTL